MCDVSGGCDVCCELDVGDGCVWGVSFYDTGTGV